MYNTTRTVLLDENTHNRVAELLYYSTDSIRCCLCMYFVVRMNEIIINYLHIVSLSLTLRSQSCVKAKATVPVRAVRNVKKRAKNNQNQQHNGRLRTVCISIGVVAKKSS